MKNSWKFFENRECEFFPCHEVDKRLPFNCKYCCCPLYHLEDCGGNFIILDSGIKDCTHCLIPHHDWEYIDDKLMELSKKKRT